MIRRYSALCRPVALAALAAFAVLGATVSLPVAAQTQRIAAVVNDQAISLRDVEERLALAIISAGIQDSPESRARLRPQVLRALIDERLKMQEAKRIGISISSAEIDESMRRIERQNNLPPGGLGDFLARSGASTAVLRTQVEGEIAWVRAVQRTGVPKIEIGSEEIDEVIAERNANRGKPEYRVGEIFLAVDEAAPAAEVLAFAERLVQQLAQGATFAAVAQSVSQSATAAVGGDLGWVQPNQLGEDLAAALTALAPGQISRPTPVPGGYAILYLHERRIATSDEDPQVTLQQFHLTLPDDAPPAGVQQRLAAARTATAGVTSCAQLEEVAKRGGSPASGSLGTVRASSLPPAVRSAVAGLEIGVPSAPLRVPGGVAVLVVCERNEAAADRNRIREALLSQRLNTFGRQYLRDLRRDAFIDIRL